MPFRFICGFMVSAFLLAFTGFSGLGTARGDEKKGELLLRSEIDGQRLVVQRIELPPGLADPVHGHDGYEVIYVLSGSLIAVLDGQESRFDAGQILKVNPGSHLSVRNPSPTATTRLLVYYLVTR